MKVFDKINMIGGLMASFLAAIFGKYWFLFLAFLILNIVDYVTGTVKAKFFMKNESSAVGAKGIVKKVMYWVVIGIAFFVSECLVSMGDIFGWNLSFLIMLGWFTLATYIINECRSILENCKVMGIKVPTVLISGLEITNTLLDKTTQAIEKGKAVEEEKNEERN